MSMFKLKNDDFYNDLCKWFPEFEERFQYCCGRQYGDDDLYVKVTKGILGEYGEYWEINIPKKDLLKVDPLKPYVWYDRDQFDGNPNNYLLVEYLHGIYEFSSSVTYELYNGTEKFMYVERAPENEEKE